MYREAGAMFEQYIQATIGFPQVLAMPFLAQFQVAELRLKA